MTPKFDTPRRNRPTTRPLPRKDRRTSLAVERLEDRVVPSADIVVGRTQSAYSALDVQNGRLDITYTVYNEQADDVSGVLLTTTLQPGVAFTSATGSPVRTGQDLGWSLGTLPAYGRASVTITVGLPASVPTQIDSGARASGTLATGTVVADTPAAGLTTRALPADQLAGTPDADTADPYVQEQAAILRYDPQAIVDYLKTDIGYESYAGSLRGARGTLWSHAGNSLDEASLGVALMRASGIPARYAHGTLTDAQSQQLILTMFPEPLRVVGYIDPGVPLADPANDPQLLAETRDHYWLQADTGTGFRDADTSGLPGSGFGTAFTTTTETFSEVADGLRHKVRVSLDAEIYNSAVAAFTGTGGLSTTTVLDQTFDTVELVGRPISIGHFVNRSGVGAGPLAAVTNTYSPYVLVDDFSGTGTDRIIRGTDYQEVITNFPLASTAVTGLFVTVAFVAPGGTVTDTVKKTLADRIGYTTRQTGGAVAALAPGTGPALSEYDLTTLVVSVSAQPQAAVLAREAGIQPLEDQLNAVLPGVQSTDAAAQSAAVQESRALIRKIAASGTALLGETFLYSSDVLNSDYTGGLLAKAYPDSPRIVSVSQGLDFLAGGATHTTLAMDLLRNSPRIVAPPFQSADTPAVLRLATGLGAKIAESLVAADLGPDLSALGYTTSTSSFDTISRAVEQNIPLVTIAATNLGDLSGLGISAEAKARITQAVRDGRTVVVPAGMVTAGGTTTVAWIEFDPATGGTTIVSEDGTHGIVEGVLADEFEAVEAGGASSVTVTEGVEVAAGRLSIYARERAKEIMFDTGKTFREAFQQAIREFEKKIIDAKVNDVFQEKVRDEFRKLCEKVLRKDPSIGDQLYSTGPTPALQNLTDAAGAGVAAAIIPDPLFTVPVGSALLPTVFRIGIKNFGPTTQRFALSFPNAPAGFTIAASLPDVSIPPGETAELSLVLIPLAGVPAAGTVVPFDVRVTSLTDPTRTTTVTASFTTPAVVAVEAAFGPAALATTPGTAVGTVLTLRSVGNAPANVTFAVTTPADVAVSGLTPVVLNPGQTVTLPVTLTPAAGVPLNSTRGVTVTVTFGPNADTDQFTVALPLRVVTPGADAIATAAAAVAPGNPDLANRLNDLSTALTNLVQTPTDPVPKGQALAALDSIRTLLLADPVLTHFAEPLAAAAAGLAAAQTPADVQTAVVALGAALDDFAATIDGLRHHGVEVLLTPNSVVAQPGVPQTFGVLLHNTGDQTTTYDLTLLGLPADVTGSFSQPTVTLAPGQFSSGLTATLTQTSTGELQAFPFQVTATAEGFPQVVVSTTGTLRTRAEVVSIVSVGVAPRFTAAGGQVAVSARVLNAVNRQQQANAYFEVRDSLGQLQYISPYTPVTLGVVQSLVTVDLGTFDTTGYADGEYTVTAILLDSTGAIIPGAIKDGRVYVGSPVATTVTTDPATLPPGTSTVTTTVAVSRGSSAAGQFQLVGQLAIPDTLVSPGIGHYTGTFNGTAYNVLYVGGQNAFYVVDVSDPTNPTLVRSKGGRATAVVLDGDRVLTIDLGPSDLNPNFASGTLSTFSLSTGAIFPVPSPANPTSIGQLNFDYQAVGGMLVSGNVVFAAEQNLFYTVGDGNVFHTQGDVVAFDITDPQHPRVLDVLDNSFGTTRDAEGINSGGPDAVFDLARADATTLYAASTTYTIQNDVTTPGVGVIRIVDVSNPAAMSQVGVFTVPNTTFVTGVTIVGNRAYVVGSEGGWLDPLASNNTDSGPTGRIVITTLDITDPRNPVLLGQSVMDRSARLAGTLVDLGGGHFALSSVGLVTDTPKLYELDLTTPGALQIVRDTDLTDAPVGVSFDGQYLYVADAVGVKVFQLGGGGAVFASVQVQVPKTTGVAVDPGSFNVPPTNVITGTDFDTLVWDVNLDDANPDDVFTFQSTVTGLQPGESRAVTLGTNVNFDFGGPGLVTLPATAVAAEQILGLTPAVQTVRPGEPATYTLTIANPAGTAVTYDLSARGVPASWVTLPAQVTVPAGGSVTCAVLVRSDPFAPIADSDFVITASVGGTHGSVEATLSLQGAPLLAPTQPQAHGVVAELLPAAATAGQGTAATFRVRVTNTGSVTETYTLAAAGLPAGVAAVFSQAQVEVPPGAGNYREVVLTLTPAAGTAAGPIPFTVSAAGTTTAAATGTLTVVARGVAVQLDRPAGAPGESFAVTVTNTGTAADVFDLAAAGPAGLVAALAAGSVALNPGESKVVTLTTGAVNFAVQGPLTLGVSAVSRGDTAARAADTAALVIPATTGLTSAVSPGLTTVPINGTADFVVTVHNTGNTEGAYTAAVTGTTGPVAAWLVAADGSLSQVTGTFRIPGLASAALLLRVALTGNTPGTATVTVTSQTDPSLTTSQTAAVQPVPVSPLPPLPPLPPGSPPPVLRPALVGGAPDGTAVVLTPAGGRLVPGKTIDFFGGFTGDVRVAVGDVTGDGVPDYVGGAGPNGGPRVVIIDGASGRPFADFFAFEESFRGGVFVAVGDLNHDGKADVIVTPDVGGGAVVVVYSGAKLAAGTRAAAAELNRFYGIDDKAFRGGAFAAVGDFDGDGFADLVVSAGVLGGPRVSIRRGPDVAAGSPDPGRLIPDFYAFEESFRNGSFVAAGDVDGDGTADLAFGAGPTGAPRVRVVNGAALLKTQHLVSLDAAIRSNAGLEYADFYAGNPDSRGGVRVSLQDVDGDRRADLVVGSGEAEPGLVGVYTASGGLVSGHADQSLNPFPDTTPPHGIFVG